MERASKLVAELEVPFEHFPLSTDFAERTNKRPNDEPDDNLNDKAKEYRAKVPFLLTKLTECITEIETSALFPAGFRKDDGSFDPYPHLGMRLVALGSLHVGTQDGAQPKPWETRNGRAAAQHLLEQLALRLPLGRRCAEHATKKDLKSSFESLASDIMQNLCRWATSLCKKAVVAEPTSPDIVRANSAMSSIAWAAKQYTMGKIANRALPYFVPCVIAGINAGRIRVQRPALRALAAVTNVAYAEMLLPYREEMIEATLRSGLMHKTQIADWACLAAVGVSLAVVGEDVTSPVLDELMDGLLAAGEVAAQDGSVLRGTAWCHAVGELPEPLGLRLSRYVSRMLPVFHTWLRFDGKEELLREAAGALTQMVTWIWPRFLGQTKELRDLHALVMNAMNSLPDPNRPRDIHAIAHKASLGRVDARPSLVVARNESPSDDETDDEDDGDQESEEDDPEAPSGRLALRNLGRLLRNLDRAPSISAFVPPVDKAIAAAQLGKA